MKKEVGRGANKRVREDSATVGARCRFSFAGPQRANYDRAGIPFAFKRP